MRANTPKFIAINPCGFAAEVRRDVRAYFTENKISQKDDGTVLTKAWIMLGLYVLPFLTILVWHQMPLGILVALVLVQGIGMAGVGMNIMHDSLHGSFNTSQKTNNLWGKTMYLLGGSVFGWKMQHNRAHHTYTNIIGFDEDIRDRKYLRLSEQAPWYPIQQYQHLYGLFLYPFMNITMFIKNFTNLPEYEKVGLLAENKTTFKKEMWRASINMVFYLLIFLGGPFFVGALSFWGSFAYFMSVQMITGFILAVVFQLAHVVEEAAQPATTPSGNIENDWMVHQLDTTVNFCPKNPILNWYVGGLNYQIEHHLFPNVCHIHYPAIAPIVQAAAEKYGYVYHSVPTFSSIFGSHMRMLKRLGQRPYVSQRDRASIKPRKSKRAVRQVRVAETVHA